MNKRPKNNPCNRSGKMTRILYLLIFIQTASLHRADAQQYDMVIKGGHVIDPGNHINRLMDVAIQDGKIALVATDISAKNALQVINAKGLYVTPGLIDIHTHVFYGNNPDQYLMDATSAVVPDGFTFRTGVTTIVDAGSSGWRTFPQFKKQVIERSYTRVFAFLNIAGAGMRGGNYEQNVNDMDPQKAADMATANKEEIVGFKVAHFEAAAWTPVDNAVSAGKLSGLPVMIDFGGDDSHPPLSNKRTIF